MKKVIVLLTLVLAFSVAALAQEEMDKMDKKDGSAATEKDKNEAIPADAYLKRGAPIASTAKTDLDNILKDPSKYSGKTVLVEGVIVRSCKTEGCWAEFASKAEAKSVRVTMKDHQFYIPLQSAGSLARIEGVFTTKTLSKAQVDHLVNEDGGKFENRNADGSVTEVSFEATGIELKKATK